MPTLKAYTLGSNGFVSADVLDVLGLPDHIRQASVTIFALSKAHAIEVLEAHHQQHAIRYTPKLSDPDFRQVGGPEIWAFLDSWVHEPAVIIEPMLSSTVTPVARLTADGTPEFWGVLRVIGGQPVFSLEQMPQGGAR